MNSSSDRLTQTARTRAQLQQQITAWRQAGETIGFVPTMGALHDGHLSLIEKVREKTSRVVVSIFVNPTQFAPGEDFEAYPRDESTDLAKLESKQTDLVYLPGVEEMYPEGNQTNVRVEGLSDLLDGIYRPHFFYGVATVVARLFLHVQPDAAAFGEKDYQQLQIIRRMVRDLGFPIEIIGGETRRDADGLAQSSRNLYLTATERRTAGALQASLHRAASRLSLGVTPSVALEEARNLILKAGFSNLDYVSLVDPGSLKDLTDAPLTKGTEARLLGAAWMGKTRLIDNISVTR